MSSEKTAYKVFVGFDGFIDEVINVVDIRYGAGDYKRLENIRDYSERIAAAAGNNCNIEYVVKQTKVGGNGVNCADSLAVNGYDVTYMGAIDTATPVYKSFLDRCVKTYPLCQPAHTDAVEFLDGKLIISKTESLNGISLDNIEALFGRDALEYAVRENELLALSNWTMIPYMDEILEKINEVASSCDTGGKFAFFDLADPRKKSRESLRKVLEIIASFSRNFKTVMSMNYKEGLQVWSALTGIEETEIQDSPLELSEKICKKLGIYGVYIHRIKDASCFVGGKGGCMEVPFCPAPVLSTGAGDHFNAGIIMGLLEGTDIEGTLELGIANAGKYIRMGHSPEQSEIKAFIKDWRNGDCNQ